MAVLSGDGHSKPAVGACCEAEWANCGDAQSKYRSGCWKVTGLAGLKVHANDSWQSAERQGSARP